MTVSQGNVRSSLLNLGIVALGLLLLVLGYSFLTRLSGTPVPDATPIPARTSDIVQVEVRNGTMVDGLASRARDFLRAEGFDVIEVGNHVSRGETRTRVVDRVGDLEAARRVARALGIDEDQVTQEIRDDLYLDTSVIIGADYQSLLPFKEETP